jgi:hypothetical protein
VNIFLFAFGWLLVIFAGIPAVLILLQGGVPGLMLLIPAVLGVLMLVTRSRSPKNPPSDDLL